MQRLRTLVRGGVLVALFTVACSQQAMAFGQVGEMRVQDGSMVVNAQSASINVQFTTVSTSGTIYIASPNGRGAYIQGNAWSSSNRASAQTNRISGGYGGQYASGSSLFSGPTGGIWYGNAVTCVDKAMWRDPCSAATAVVKV